MEIITILLISLGLAMDAFAVSVSNALSKHNLTKAQFLSYPVAFGVFQGVMPLIGYFIGTAFESIVTAVDHWIALVLLGFIGGKMIVEGVIQLKKAKANANSDAKEPQDETQEVVEVSDADKKTGKYSFGELLVQGVATSIDALAVGVTLALTVQLSIYVSVGVIAAVTFVISLIGMVIGKKVGEKLSDTAGIIGGVILVGIGLKIFLEHLLG